MAARTAQLDGHGAEIAKLVTRMAKENRDWGYHPSYGWISRARVERPTERQRKFIHFKTNWPSRRVRKQRVSRPIRNRSLEKQLASS